MKKPPETAPEQPSAPQAPSLGAAPTSPSVAPEDDEPKAKPGSGETDETNGVCRLFAPQLPEPDCCPIEYGFDAAFVGNACGYPIYLGESLHYSCNYHFYRETTSQMSWFRMGFAPGATPKQAAEQQDRQLQNLKGGKFVSHRAYKEAPGVYLSKHNDYNWAFLPGWSKVRMFVWKDGVCEDGQIAKVISQLVAAKEPPADSPRLGLLPKARK